MKDTPLSGSDVGIEYYNECRFHEFNRGFAMSLATIVDLCRGEDDEFMCDFWDALREKAEEDNDFAKMLIQSNVMERDDIYGIEEHDNTMFDDELDEDSDNF
jgi:hypothetical protein